MPQSEQSTPIYTGIPAPSANAARAKTWLDLFSHHRANDFQLHFELSGVVAGVVPLTNARHALFATALADIAQGIRFKLCARKGCGVPFPVKSEHLKKVKRFHNTKYGHLALVQKGREEEKKKRRAKKSLQYKGSRLEVLW